MKLSKTLAATLFTAVAASSFAHTEEFFAVLSGAAEVPPNASPGTGWARVTLDLDLVTMRVEATFSGLMGTTSAAHIHARNSAANTTGGVATQTPTFTGLPLGVTSGSMDQTFDMTQASSYNAAFITNNGGTVGSAYNTLVAKLRGGLTYFNLHSTAFPSGELRGDLQMVPEPATMTALGIGALALLRRKRAAK